MYNSYESAKTESRRLLAGALSDYSVRTGLRLRGGEAEYLEIGPRGKPVFEKLPSVKFSVAHSGSRWACIMGLDEVGLDAEDLSMRRRQDSDRARTRGGAGEDIASCGERYIRIARRFFTADESGYVEGAAGAYDDIIVRFFHIWTKKEAYVKYTGHGLGTGFSCFSVLDGGLDVYFGSIEADRGLSMSYCCSEAGVLLGVVFLD